MVEDFYYRERVPIIQRLVKNSYLVMFHYLKWNWSQEIKKEQTYIKEEVIEVQVQKKSNKQKRNDTMRSVFKLFSDWSTVFWLDFNQLFENQIKQLGITTNISDAKWNFWKETIHCRWFINASCSSRVLL